MRSLTLVTIVAISLSLFSCGPKPVANKPHVYKRGEPVHCAVPAVMASSGAESAENPLPDKLRPDQVQAELTKFVDGVRHCGAWRPPGSGSETINFSIFVEPPGYVSTVIPVGKYRNTTLGRCAARKLCEAHFPAAKKGLLVNYPFKL